MSECLLAWFGKAQTKTIINPILAHTQLIINGR